MKDIQYCFSIQHACVYSSIEQHIEKSVVESGQTEG